MSESELPLIDEHAVEIAAGVADVWAALLMTVDRSFSGKASAAYARAVGCVPPSAAGPRPLTEGSAIPGFAVTEAVPGAALALEGRHRFSTYALIFRLDDLGSGSTRLRAESRAVFPGLHGRAYRLAVISSGGHVAAVRRMLAAVDRAATKA